MVRKNFIVKKRNWKSTLWELILPLILGLLAGAYTADLTNPNPNPL
jgi:hypothetical protein